MANYKSLERQLTKIRNGRTKTINNLEITREDDRYIIDEHIYDITEAIEQLKTKGKAKPKNVFNYAEIAWMLFDGYKHISTHQCCDKNEYNQLVIKAKTKGYVIQYAATERRDGQLYAVRPFLIDFSTITNLQEKTDADIKKVISYGLQCPYCDTMLGSTSGRTLHIKNKHPEKFEDYHRVLDSKEGIVEVDLHCPYCDQEMKSTSGLTNHVKSKHQKNYTEYQSRTDK